jgi:hypothetical protein
MRTLTLQEQYNLLSEDKINKWVFLRDAKKLYPNYIRNAAPFDEALNILLRKGVIVENKKETPITKELNFFKIFEEKTTPEKEVMDSQNKGYDSKDKKNIDNVFGTEFLKGFQIEMEDPKNETKTVDQLKGIVAKNLAKDSLYYVKDGQFGLKKVGYQTELPGLGTPKEAKGKYKSSGYGNLKEGTYQTVYAPPQYYEEPNFKVGDHVIYKGIKHKITRILEDGRVYIKSIKYESRPEVWVKVEDLKKSKSSGYGNLKEGIHDRNILSAPHTNIKDNEPSQSNEETAKEISDRNFKLAAEKAESISQSEGVAQHVNYVGTKYNIERFEVSDWYDEDNTVASFENGRKLNEREKPNNSKGWEGLNEMLKSTTSEGWEGLNEMLNIKKDMKSLKNLLSETEYYMSHKKEEKKPKKKEEKKTVKKSLITDKIKEIEQQGSVAALEAKMSALDEEIQVREDKLAMVQENEALSEFVNQSKINEMQKEIKELQKAKEKYTKLYEKATGGSKKEIIDEENDEELE